MPEIWNLWCKSEKDKNAYVQMSELCLVPVSLEGVRTTHADLAII